jgi:hypothetical protein
MTQKSRRPQRFGVTLVRWFFLLLAHALPLAAQPTTDKARLAPVAGDTTALGVPQLGVSYCPVAPIIDGRAQDAAWQGLRTGILVDAITGGRAPAPTTFRIAYDDSALYVFITGIERGQESRVVGPSRRRDLGVHDGDAGELFLQPGGPGTPCYQIAANPWGGSAEYKWLAPRQPTTWAAEGLEVAGWIDPDSWSLELAVPFTALGRRAPVPGEEWRVNICRNELPGERLYGAWSATGDLFNNPLRFGRLTFLGRGASAAGQVCQVTGRLLLPGGEPAVDIPVRAYGRIEHTDELGRYTFAEVAPGEQVLEVVSPSHLPFRGRFALSASRLELEPEVLQPIDLYRPSYPVTAPPAGRWLVSSLDEPPEMILPPAASADLDTLRLLAAPGQYESVAVAYLAGRELVAPGAQLDRLAGVQTAISSPSLRVRWTQRLLKREHYQTSRENSVPVWRFLWDEPPERLEAGHLRQLVLTVRVPDDTPAGIYRGELRLSTGGAMASSLPVILRVTGFRLATPAKRVGSYFQFSDPGGIAGAWTETMLRDIREHGGAAVMWWVGPGITTSGGELCPDTTQVSLALRLLHRLGFEPPYTVGTCAEEIAQRLGIPGRTHALDPAALRQSEAYHRTYLRFVRAVKDLEAALGLGPFCLFWSDEIFQPGRLAPWLVTAALTHQETDQQVYITIDSGEPEKMAQIDPFVDIRCYHGQKLDQDYTSATSYDSLGHELAVAGDQAWAYHNIVRADITPEYTRLANGYWLWRTPVSVHVPWTYFDGDQNGLVGVREGRAEAPYFAFAAPHPDTMAMVSTLDWECYREGYDDLRYLTTLEQAVTAAVDPTDQAVEQARALLHSWWDRDPRVASQAAALTAADYAQRRQQMAALIEQLQRGTTPEVGR